MNAGPMRVLLSELDAKSLRTLAAEYRKFAAAAEDRADTLDRWDAMRADNAARIARLGNLPAVVSAYVAAGMGLEPAFAAAAKAEGCPVETVALYWRNFLRGREDETKAARDTLVMRLARRGYSNRNIAGRMGLHEVTVCRIIRRALDR